MSIENPSFENEPPQERGGKGAEVKEGESMVDKIMRENDEKRRSKMTPEQVTQEDELYKMADDLVKGVSADRVDSLTANKLAEVMSKDWPEQMKKNTIKDIMKMHLQLKKSSQETDRKLQESDKRLKELRKERIVADENVKKANEAVRKHT